MKRVLVNFTGRTAGGPLYAYNMIKGMLADGAEVSAIISSSNCMLDDFQKLPLKKLVIIDTYHDKVSFLLNTLRFLIFKRKKIRNLLIHEKFDFIYCPMYTYWSVYINRLFLDLPLYVTLHDPVLHSGESWFNQWFFTKACGQETKRAKKIIVLSRIFQKDVAERYNKKLEDVLVVPHGVFNNYQAVRKESISHYNKNKINFVFFGRIEEYKGIAVLLDAYHEIENIYGDQVTLTLAGNGDFSPYREKFQQLHHATLINRYIEDDEVAGLFYGEHVVTVLPYLDATQSGVVSIAMQNNNLIIATQTGGLAEQLGDGKYGLLVPPADSESLFKCMEQVVLHYHNYDMLRQAAYESLEKLSWDYLAQKILDA